MPLLLMDIEEHCARRIGCVGGMHFSPRELPDEPGIDRAKCQLAPLRPCPDALDVIQNPGEFGRGEVRVQQ